jgi:16S rRNA (guanine527-N7)-methyltransferase
MNTLWQQLTQRAGRELTAEQDELLSRYLDLLLAANERMNLTRITDRATAEVQHVGDALTLLPFLPTDAHTLADVGTGGGVPGIPLAIVRPDVNVTLIESTKKKAAFLREAIAQLGLTNVRVDARRAELIGALGKPTRESFDVVVVRAVATMIWLVEWCLPLVKKKGRMLAMKGPKGREELTVVTRRTFRMLGAGDREPIVHDVDLPGTDARIIVQIDKTAQTDRRLPRDPTAAKGKPIT